MNWIHTRTELRLKMLYILLYYIGKTNKIDLSDVSYDVQTPELLILMAKKLAEKDWRSANQFMIRIAQQGISTCLAVHDLKRCLRDYEREQNKFAQV